MGGERGRGAVYEMGRDRMKWVVCPAAYYIDTR